ncbi:MAG TPA: HNH endonuclease signature motif containing protein [Pseudoxanthomonas sp.]
MPEPNTGCWLWLGAVYREQRNHQYGVFSLGNRRVSVHRAAFARVNGPIPPKMVVRHKCDVCLCVNPAHMELGTQADNVRDMMIRRRSHHHTNPAANVRAALAANATMKAQPHRRARGDRHGKSGAQTAGEKNGFAKLTEAQVMEIRQNPSALSQRELGRQFGVHQATIWKIMQGKAWVAAALRARAADMLARAVPSPEQKGSEQ